MLTNVKLKALKPKDKLYAVSDEKGLVLRCVYSWRQVVAIEIPFWWEAKKLSVRTYPDAGLKQAWEQRGELRKQIANGVDPFDIRKLCLNRHLFFRTSIGNQKSHLDDTQLTWNIEIIWF